jgi:hypothetical protein
MVRPIMEECGSDEIAGHSVTGPCTAFYGRLVEESRKLHR